MDNIIPFPNSKDRAKLENFEKVRKYFEIAYDSNITEQQWEHMLKTYLQWWKVWEQPNHSFRYDTDRALAAAIVEYIEKMENRVVSTLEATLVDLMIVTHEGNVKKED